MGILIKATIISNDTKKIFRFNIKGLIYFVNFFL